MALPFNCALGHQWSADSKPLNSSAQVCPECGQIGTPIALNRMVLSGDATVTPPVSDLDLAGTRPVAATADETLAREAELPRVSDYKLIELLGRGGMGVVYKARQIGLNRLVALKMVLAGPHASSDALARFRAEAEAVAKLQHPNIVQVFDIGEQDGRPFFAMEFIAGGSLARHLRGEPQSPIEAARTVETLARAIHHAHLAGIVHRDLKPANILVKVEGGRMKDETDFNRPLGSSFNLHPSSLKITDFGLAKDLQADEGQTTTGTIIGTPSYMAPEQAEGRVKAVGPATDVYALGAILYELLVGRPPFRAATPMDTMMQVMRDSPVPPVRLQPKIPRDLDTICMKCLEKEPARRYATAEALADDLERFERGEPVLARPVSRLEWGWRWCWRNPVVAGSLAAVVLALVAGTVVSIAFALRADEDRDAAREAKRDADRHAAEAVTERNEAYHNQYLAHMSVADAYWNQANFIPVRDLMERYRETAAGRRNPRGWEWHFQERLLDTSLRTLEGHTKGVSCVRFGHGGATLASSSTDGAIRIWDIATGKCLRTIEGHKDGVNRIAFSPDGTLLASAGNDKTARLWDVMSGQCLRTFEGHTNLVYCVAFSPDGARLATSSADRTVRLWEVSSGQLLQELYGHNERILSVVFSPDGGKIASCGYDNIVRLWDSHTGRLLQGLSGHSLVIYGVAFSPDGALMVSTAGDQTIRLWDVASGTLRRTLASHAGGVWSAVFSPDGARLASAHGDGAVRTWDVATGKLLHIHHGHTKPVLSVAYSRDGTRIASGSGDQTVRLWNALGSPPVRVLYGHPGGVAGVTFSPDGALIASASSDATVRLWDTLSGETVRTLAGHTRPVWGLAFSLDGAKLASGSYDNTIRLWDPTNGACLRTLQGHTSGVTGVAFSRDGRLLASSANDQTARLWDVASGRLLHTLQGHTGPVWSVAFSPDGTRLASASWDTTVRLWDVRTGKHVQTLKGHTIGATKVVYSPDGTLLATCSADQTVRLWDAASGHELRTFYGHTDPLWGIAFSPDGTRLASASWDKTVRLWDVASGQPLRTLHGHSDKAWSVAFSPDGTRLVSGSSDQTVRVWDARPLTSKIQVERETAALLDVYRANGLTQAEAALRLRDQVGISAEVRELAQSFLHRAADDPQRFNSAAWQLIRERDAPAVQYESALRQAQTAVRLLPNDGYVCNTLGVAQYRSGQYLEALANLQRAYDLNLLRGRRTMQLDLGRLLMSPWLLPATNLASYEHPADLAFLAMTHYRIGHDDEARGWLSRLRIIIQQRRWAEDEEVQSFLREAEAVCAGLNQRQ